MAMVMSVRRIVTDDAAVIAGIDQWIDICEVVPHDSVLAINPNFPAHDATSISFGHVKLFIDYFPNPYSHDIGYHICSLNAPAASRRDNNALWRDDISSERQAD